AATNIATKLMSDDVGLRHLGISAAWAGAGIALGAAATITNMTAFQRCRATVVVPVTTMVQTFLPIVLQPLLLREYWGSARPDGALLRPRPRRSRQAPDRAAAARRRSRRRVPRHARVLAAVGSRRPPAARTRGLPDRRGRPKGPSPCGARESTVARRLDPLAARERERAQRLRRPPPPARPRACPARARARRRVARARSAARGRVRAPADRRHVEPTC